MQDKIKHMAREKKEQEKPKTYREELLALKEALKPKINEETYISSGSIEFDKNLGGKGWQCGWIAEIIAWEGSGKTTECLETVLYCQKNNWEYAYVDAEHALDKEYAIKLGIDWEHFEERLFQPNNGEEAFEIGKTLLKTGKLKLLIYDSVGGMLPQKQMEGEAGESYMGKHAELFSKQVPIINYLAHTNNALVIFVSQVREKPGVMFGSPETTQAGHALKFFAGYRVWFRKEVEQGEDPSFIKTKYKIIKNKTSTPYKTGDFNIVFGEGIDDLRELLVLGVDLGILEKAGTWFCYKDMKIGQGIDNAKVTLKDNPELTEEIKKQILEKI